jgi:hypothetical protein
MQADVWQLVYEPPRPGSIDVDTGWIYTTEERVNPNGAPAVGEYQFTTAPHDIIQDVFNTAVFNDALDSADVSLVTLQLDDQFYANRLDRRLWDVWQRAVVGRDLPRGVFYFPFDRLKDADGAIANFDPFFGLSIAEWLDTSDIANIYTNFNITGGIAGATNQIWQTVRRLTRITG